MLSALATGFVLGLSAAVPLGPVNLEIMRRGLAGGFRPAVAVGLGASTIDGVYAILFTLGFTSLQDPSFLRVLGIAGALVLVFLGVSTIVSALRKDALPTHPQLGSCEPSAEECSVDSGIAAQPPMSRGYLTGLAMTATNPITLTFWASVGATASTLALDSTATRILFGLSVVAGALLWVFGFGIFLDRARHAVTPRVQGLLTIAGGLGITGFGVRLLITRLAY